MDEDLIELVCNVRWPAQTRAGTFRKTIGRVTETPTTYQMPSFSVSLLRDPDAFSDFCKPHLNELQTQVRQPWELWFDVECNSKIMRQALPPVIPPVTGGPFTADQLVDASGKLRAIADIMWVHLQTYEVANVQVFKSGIGMMSHAVHDLYRWFWGNKDRSLPGFETADDQLREGYLRLARRRSSEGDEAMAAEYSKVTFDLSDAEEVASEIWAEFVSLTARWDKIAAAKENAVKRVATVAREGGAEWLNLKLDRYFRDGLIKPITKENEEFYSSGRTEAHRKRLKSLSAGNPYRKGLELMEKVETDLGFWAAMHGGIITEWPLEELRRRVPTFVVDQVRRGSPWAPDTRLMRLSELSLADVKPVPFTGGIMPLLGSVHESLDGRLPGVLTHALDQLPDT
jgi:hypothetical protein